MNENRLFFAIPQVYSKQEIIRNQQAVACKGELPTPEELILQLANEVRARLAAMGIDPKQLAKQEDRTEDLTLLP